MQHFAGIFSRLLADFADIAFSEGAAGLLRAAGDPRSPENLRDESRWSTYGQIRPLLEAAASQLGDPCELVRASRETTLAAGMPELIDSLQHLGAPGPLYQIVVDNQAVYSSVVDLQAEELGPTEWRVRQRFHDGFEPFNAYCWFAAGMWSAIPRVFGYDNAEVIEESCQVEGDAWCSFRLRWKPTDDLVREAQFYRDRAAITQRRLESLQATVDELVSSAPLSSLLERILSSVSRSLLRPAFLLAVEPIAGAARQVFAVGIDDGDAERIAAALLAGNLESDTSLVADIASAHRHYGRIVALGGSSPLPQEQATLWSYARLAASALDSATALAESRAQADCAEALLALSTSLTTATSAGEIASILVAAVPAVTGASAGLILIDQAEGLVARAHTGFREAVTERLRRLQLPGDASLGTEIQYHEHGTSSAAARTVLAKTGATRIMTVPMMIDGAIAGYVVGAELGPNRDLEPCGDLTGRFQGLAALASTALANARLTERIRHLALHDALTGLANRTLLDDRIEHLLRQARREHSKVAALFLDLDGFKNVNDTLGHGAGDELLRGVAARLTAVVRESDTVGRLGGDEFVVLTTVTSQSEPTLVAERIIAVLNESFDLESHGPVRIGASIGIAIGDHDDADALLHNADQALYQAKAAGKNCFVVFAPDVTASTEDAILEAEVRESLQRGDTAPRVATAGARSHIRPR